MRVLTASDCTVCPQRGTQWRYYSAFACSNRRYRGQVCLTFKEMVLGNQITGLRLRRGRRAIPYSITSLFRFPWDQGMFAHNHAILQLPNDSWVAIGGMEGFVANTSCNRQKSPACLRVADSGRNASPFKPAKGATAIIAGIRVTQGIGWRWGNIRRSMCLAYT